MELPDIAMEPHAWNLYFQRWNVENRALGASLSLSLSLSLSMPSRYKTKVLSTTYLPMFIIQTLHRIPA